MMENIPPLMPRNRSLSPTEYTPASTPRSQSSFSRSDVISYEFDNKSSQELLEIWKDTIEQSSLNASAFAFLRVAGIKALSREFESCQQSCASDALFHGLVVRVCLVADTIFLPLLRWIPASLQCVPLCLVGPCKAGYQTLKRERTENQQEPTPCKNLNISCSKGASYCVKPGFEFAINVMALPYLIVCPEVDRLLNPYLKLRITFEKEFDEDGIAWTQAQDALIPNKALTSPPMPPQSMTR